MEIINKISDLKNRYVFMILFVIGIIAYANVLMGDFIWDESVLIVNNEYIRSFGHFPKWFTENSVSGAGLTYGNLYRPLQLMIYTVIYSIFGQSEIPYHAINIFLHIANAFLVFVFLQKLDFKKFGSLLAAILFLLHPVQTESVSYIAATPDVLSPFFTLLALIFFMDEKNTSAKKRYLLPAIFTVLAVLSKETGVLVLPLAILTLWFKWQKLNREHKEQMLKSLAIIGAVTLTYFILRLAILNFKGTFSLSASENPYTENISYRIYTFFTSLAQYMKLTFYPVNLYFEKAFDIYTYIAPKVQLGIWITVLATALAVGSLYKKRHFFFAYAWFVITIALVSGIILPSNATYREHWLYLPMIGMVALIPSIFESLQNEKSKKYFLTIFVILSILFTFQTIHRNTQWSDFLTFFRNEIKYNDKSARLYDRLSTYYFNKKEYDKAVEYGELAIQFDEADLYSSVRVNLGNAYLASQNLPAAINEFFTVLETYPNNFEAHIALYNIAIAVHNKPMEEAFFGFLERIKAGESIDFAKEILPFVTVNY